MHRNDNLAGMQTCCCSVRGGLHAPGKQPCWFQPSSCSPPARAHAAAAGRPLAARAAPTPALAAPVQPRWQRENTASAFCTSRHERQHSRIKASSTAAIQLSASCHPWHPNGQLTDSPRRSAPASHSPAPCRGMPPRWPAERCKFVSAFKSDLQCACPTNRDLCTNTRPAGQPNPGT